MTDLVPHATPAPAYTVYCGVFAHHNPGIHAVGMVTLHGDQRDEWATVIRVPRTTPTGVGLPATCTTPMAWRAAVEAALRRVQRPEARVVIYVRDIQLSRAFADPPPDHPAAPLYRALRERANTMMEWRGRATGCPYMERAQALAMVALRDAR